MTSRQNLKIMKTCSVEKPRYYCAWGDGHRRGSWARLVSKDKPRGGQSRDGAADSRKKASCLGIGKDFKILLIWPTQNPRITSAGRFSFIEKEVSEQKSEAPDASFEVKPKLWPSCSQSMFPSWPTIPHRWYCGNRDQFP